MQVSSCCTHTWVPAGLASENRIRAIGAVANPAPPRPISSPGDACIESDREPPRLVWSRHPQSRLAGAGRRGSPARRQKIALASLVKTTGKTTLFVALRSSRVARRGPACAVRPLLQPVSWLLDRPLTMLGLIVQGGATADGRGGARYDESESV